MYWIHPDGTKEQYAPVTFFTGGTSSYAHSSGDYVKTGFVFTKFTDPNIDTRKNTWGSFTWSYFVWLLWSNDCLAGAYSLTAFICLFTGFQLKKKIFRKSE